VTQTIQDFSNWSAGKADTKRFVRWVNEKFRV